MHTSERPGEPENGEVRPVLAAARAKAGRIVFNGWPTGVSVTAAQQHGGPYPATASIARTSVGTAAIERFLRPLAYQDAPDQPLPPRCRRATPSACPGPPTPPGLPEGRRRHRLSAPGRSRSRTGSEGWISLRSVSTGLVLHLQ